MRRLIVASIMLGSTLGCGQPVSPMRAQVAQAEPQPVLEMLPMKKPKTTQMQVVALRLKPGEDLMTALKTWAADVPAASVLSVVGSLNVASLRFANQPQPTLVQGPLEILSLSGTLSKHGTHLHLSVADGQGKMTGGHLKEGSKVYTTVEVVLGVYPGLVFDRELDPTYGYKELVVKPAR